MKDILGYARVLTLIRTTDLREQIAMIVANLQWKEETSRRIVVKH